jgi:branched-chain amino acid transport system permease protein
VGLLDLGFTAFYAIGAYTTAILSLHGWSFWLCLPVSVLVSVGIRLLLCAPLARLQGDYLAIVTLGFGEITRIVLNNWDGLTQGPRGISLLSSSEVQPIGFFGFSLNTNTHYVYLITAFVLLGIVASSRLDRSRLGRAWSAIRDNELAAESMGVPVARMKIMAFALSSVFAAVAGTIFARWENFVTPESFTFWESILVVSMVVLGGMGSLPGVLVGTVLIVGLPEILRSEIFVQWGAPMVNARYLIFGILLVTLALFRPQGIWPRRRGTD